MKKKVLLLTRNLPPLLGGMENLNFNLAQGLVEYAELTVIGPKGSRSLFSNGIDYKAVALKPLWRFLVESMFRAVSHANKHRPNVVLGGSGLMAPAVLVAARIAGAKAVLYVHGLDLIVPHRLYQWLWGPVIRRADLLICNSQPTLQLARNMGVAEDRLKIVRPGVAVKVLPVSDEDVAEFRARYRLGNALLLLSVGRLTARKGLHEFVRYALPDIVSRYPKAVLAVIGDAPSDALHAQPQKKEDIMATAEKCGVSDNIKFLGRISEAELICAYQASAVHVFPVREIEGDPEGFGMVAIESAARGLPTVAFACGGVVDAVADGRSGFLIPPEQYAMFVQKVCDLLAGQVDLAVQAQEFAQNFDWPHFNSAVKAVLEDLLRT